MSRIWMPFLIEHGLKRNSRMRKGWASKQYDKWTISIGYELGIGFYDWTGNDISLEGEVLFPQVLRLDLSMNRFSPESGLLPFKLRAALRSMGIRRLQCLLNEGQTINENEPNYLILGKSFREQLAWSKSNPRYVPPFRYQNESDLRLWCKVVTPYIPECLAALSEQSYSV